MNYIKDLDIINRDIKAENIILRDNEDTNDVVINDFEFAAKVADNKNLLSRCESLCYVSPEVFNEIPHSCKADVFSSGIRLYNLHVSSDF